jgi:hypothetical protein
MHHASANPSAAQTNAALVPAKAGRYVIVKGVFVSSDTEMQVSLVNSVTHSLVWTQYVRARGGSQVGGTPMHELRHTLQGEGMDLTTSADGNVFVTVQYGYSDE